MNQQDTTDTPKSNVIFMADYILRRRADLVNQANELIEKARKLSKKDNPRDDVFAAPLLAKVDKLAERVEGMEKHLRFIINAANANAVGGVIPARGYQTSYHIPQQPPAKITVSMAPPIQ